MVAITVVLAAVLYVMATSLLGGGGGLAIPPAVDLVPTAVDATTWTAEVQSNRAAGLVDFRVSMLNLTGGAVCIDERDLTASFNASCDPRVILTFEDVASPASATLNGGDLFRLSGLSSGFYYRINLVWKPTGGIIKSLTLPTS